MWVGLLLLLILLSPTSAVSSSSYEVPSVSLLTGEIYPEINFRCLIRAEPSGALTDGTQVQVRRLCYEEALPLPPPPPPPPPFRPGNHSIHSATYSGGILSLSLLECTELLPGVLAWSLSATISLGKGGGTAVGNSQYILDSTAPFDCAAGSGTTQTSGPLALTPLAQSHDEDGDGCTDWEELGPVNVSGGQRDPFNFWDFFDTPNSANQRDKIILTSDISRVVARYGTNGDKTGDPLSPPPPTGYHTAFDRGGSIGPNGWNLRQPDGKILTPDISAVVASFGASCIAAP